MAIFAAGTRPPETKGEYVSHHWEGMDVVDRPYDTTPRTHKAAPPMLVVEVARVAIVLYVYDAKIPEYGVAMATATIVPKRTPRVGLPHPRGGRTSLTRCRLT